MAGSRHIIDISAIKDRSGVETLIQGLIDMLDATDGDVDLEEETDLNGDEGDFAQSEDDALARQLDCDPSGLIGGQGL